ncbi:MAG TPA: hypothetical protein VNY24_04810 [Candidatus Acidoferrales bacterium]|jgi:hypothetical protein|nr:hypothetical protein [Candidatus Acidoferrales bacterium]
MISIDPQAAMKLQPYLSTGERIHWAAMPNPRIILHSDDWYLIPFSLLWGGFAIFWEAGALGIWDSTPKSGPMSSFMSLWGIPFVAFGQYMIWGRFVWDAWLKRHTYYAVTDRRVLIFQEGWNRKTHFSFLDSIPEISREGNDVGSLWLGTKLPVISGRRSSTRSMSRFSINDAVPTLADIDNVDSVYHLILDLREQTRKQSQPQT